MSYKKKERKKKEKKYTAKLIRPKVHKQSDRILVLICTVRRAILTNNF